MGVPALNQTHHSHRQEASCHARGLMIGGEIIEDVPFRLLCEVKVTPEGKHKPHHEGDDQGPFGHPSPLIRTSHFQAAVDQERRLLTHERERYRPETREDGRPDEGINIRPVDIFIPENHPTGAGGTKNTDGSVHRKSQMIFKGG